jgi:hypothetical protein
VSRPLLRSLSKSELIRVAELAVVERHGTQVAHGRLRREWWLALAGVAGASFAAGVVITWLLLR